MNEIGALLGSGKEADVHVYGDHALKLYKSPGVKAPAFREAANLAVVERLGLPAPHVYAAGRHDGRWGIVMDRAPGASFGSRIKAEGLQPVLAEMVQLQLRLHAVPGTGLASLKDRLTANIRKAPEIGSALRATLLWQLGNVLPRARRMLLADEFPPDLDTLRILPLPKPFDSERMLRTLRVA